MAKIEIHNLTVDFYDKKYGGSLKEAFTHLFGFRKFTHQTFKKPVLENINLVIEKGEKVAFIGKNGMGKSTLLKVISGIYPPSHGEVFVHGEVTPLIELGVGFDDSLTGRENIKLMLGMRGKNLEFIQKMEQPIIEFAELQDKIDLQVKNYSSGMRSRLFFSIATCLHSEILILDEVFATGDASFVKKATGKIVQTIEDSDIVLMVSHNNERLKSICTRGIVIDKGGIVYDGAIEEAINFYKKNILG